MPDLLPRLCSRLIDRNLEQETALEGSIHIVRKIGSRNHNAVKRFQLLKDDVLNRVFSLCRSRGADAAAFRYDCIRFVQKQDRHERSILHRISAELLIFSEQRSYDFFAFTEPA